MVDLVMAEILKLRRSKMFLLSLIGAAVAPIMVVLAFYLNMEEEAVVFDTVIYNTSLYTVLLVGVPLYSVVAAYLFNREYAEDTLKNLLTIPVSRTGLILSKMLLLLMWILLLTLISWGLTIVLGLLCQFEGFSSSLMLESVIEFIVAGLFLFALSTPMILITILMKNIVAAMVAAICINLVNVLIFNSEHRGLMPWTAAFDLAHGMLLPVYPAAVSYFMIAIVSFAGFIASIVYFRRADVT